MRRAITHLHLHDDAAPMGKKLDRARNFFRDLKRSDSPAVAYYLHGAETFMLDQAVDAVVDFAAPGGVDDFNFDFYQGREATGHAVVSACEMLPMMAPRRVVLLRDAQEMPMSELAELGDYLDNPSPTTCLIVHANTAQKRVDGRKSVIRKLKKVATHCEFAALYENEVGQILQRHAASRRMTLSAAASAYLIEAVGTDLTSLNSALDKIDLFLGDTSSDPRAVEDEQVRAVVADTRVRTVFDLTDALGDQRFEEALLILDRMLLHGEGAIGILAMIARHFRIVARLQDPSVRQLSRREQASAVGVVPFFLKDYQRHARSFSLRDLSTIRAKILEVDEGLKSTGLDDRTLMEALLYDICFRRDSGASAL